MTGFDIAVLVFLVLMTIMGVIVEIDKRKKRRQMTNLLSSESPWADTSRKADIEVLDESALALVADSLPRNFEKIQEEQRLFEKQIELLERQNDPATALPEEEFNREMKRLEDAQEKANSESFLALPEIENLVQVDQFVAEDSYLSDVSGTGIAIDRTAKRVALLTSYGRTVVTYSDLVSTEVAVDSETVIKTDRLGQIGGAVLGGVVTGGIGALVMAMGAKKKQIGNIRRVDLKVLTTSSERAIHNVCFYEKSQWSSPSGAVREAEKWHDLLTVAIHEARREESTAAQQRNLSPSTSIADELRKLAHLRDEGLLSEDEFTSAKARLLGHTA